MIGVVPSAERRGGTQAMKMCLIPLAMLAFLATDSAAIAQSFPTRSVTIVATSAPGALTDVLARAVGQRLSQKWNQPVVVENRPGAAYAIAAVAVSKAAPDGYTLIASELGMFTSQQHLYQGQRPFDGDKDFAPISGFAEIPMAVIAHPSLPAKSITELIALAKAKPGSITYGTAGPGTAPHLGVLLLESLSGIKLAAVHYRGVAPALNDVIAGHINMITMGPSIALSNYRTGKLAILGIGSAQPIPQLPEVATVGATVRGYEASVSFGLAAPAATPRDVVGRINADVQEVLRDSAFQAKVLEPQLLRPMFGTPQAFAAYLASESRKWGKVIKDANLRID
jgi:tripartite-type tricarboxylate transporter receptor subunit TctC